MLTPGSAEEIALLLSFPEGNDWRELASLPLTFSGSPRGRLLRLPYTYGDLVVVPYGNPWSTRNTQRMNGYVMNYLESEVGSWGCVIISGTDGVSRRGSRNMTISTSAIYRSTVLDTPIAW